MENSYEIFRIQTILKITKYLTSPILFLTIVISIVGLYLGLFYAPEDFRQGEYYRIIYIHVPSSWCALLLYIKLAFDCLIFIITRHPLLLIMAKISAKIGTIFTLISLCTGSLWGIPMWGTYWVWDARLTSVLILFFIYLSFLTLNYMVSKNTISPIIPCILAIFGLLNIPIIKFSVDWWNTLHQPASITEFGSTIDAIMLLPLLIVFIACLLFILFIFMNMLRTDIINIKTYNIKQYNSNSL